MQYEIENQQLYTAPVSNSPPKPFQDSPVLAQFKAKGKSVKPKPDIHSPKASIISRAQSVTLTNERYSRNNGPDEEAKQQEDGNSMGFEAVTSDGVQTYKGAVDDHLKTAEMT